MKKKTAILLLCVILAVTSLPINAFAAKNKTNEEPEEVERVIEPIDSGRSIYDTVSDGVTTGTQQKAQEKVTDPDADLVEDIYGLIGTDWEYIEISNADELMEFAKQCRLDTWSCNKHVTLTDDISLLGRSFTGIPTFGGVFDGKGHTIGEVSIKSSASYVGLFSSVQKNAVIKNLNVTGTVVPEGSQVIVGGIAGDNSGVITKCSFEGAVSGNDYVGGIAGINELSGVISGCDSKGIIKGVHFTGGIAGENLGDITTCTNNASVNTSNVDTTLTEQSVSHITTVIELLDSGFRTSDDEAQNTTTVTDTGGIAGQSIGIITHCVNHGTIGYEHVGYNTGGIIGRQSGYVFSCINNGLVLGRKDVGGIVGQAEPYITIDFSQDVAYQLSEAINKLHDLVNVTLSDTRNQSDVITGRLSVIQQYTSNAITDAKYLAENTVDFVNGVSNAATESFSRVDYILAQSSKQDGLLDKTAYAFTNIGSAMEGAKETVNDLELTQYMSPEDKAAYNDAKNTIEKSTVEYKDYYSKAYRAYYNYYIYNHAGDSRDAANNIDLKYKKDDGTYVMDQDAITINGHNYSRSAANIPACTAADDALITDFNQAGSWVHCQAAADYAFPSSDYANDSGLASNAAAKAADWANVYSQAKYLAQNGTSYTDDIATASGDVTRVMYSALDSMSGEARSDAIDSISSLEAAAYNLSSATSQTKTLVNDVVSMGKITFPTLSADYKTHTTSLADNMQVMNDNFGLLNQEINNATYTLTGDLEAVNDQFNTIMLLYTDALDGVLEKDYTEVFTDDSLSVAQTCTDATLDSCMNYGYVKGDINVAGIAGTMAIEYDYDLESDVTGFKDSDLNTSYITKCVLRDNRNYEEISCVKSYAGGICGLQEMGTIIGDENYASVSSESGDYVGGIAGSSLSYIVSSFAKGHLTGTNYVGGIAGDGNNIRDCVTLVNPEATSNWCGAIAGHVSDDGEIRNNYFVDNGTAGIDRVSYSYKAEPVAYSELMNVRRSMASAPVITEEAEGEDGDSPEDDQGSEEPDEEDSEPEEAEEIAYFVPVTPSDFEHLTVTFMLDDEDADEPVKLTRIKADYGEHLGLSDYPEVKPKDGFYVDWDRHEIDCLSKDETVTAVYKRYLTTLAASSSSDDVHISDLLVDGQFKEEDSFVVARTLNFVEGDKSTLSDYVDYELIIPDDGADVHQIRYLPDTVYGDKAYDSMVLYEYKDGDWTELKSTGRMGKYFTYDVEGNNVKLKLDLSKLGTKTDRYIALAVVIGIVVLGVLGVVIWFVTRRRSRKEIKKAYRKVKSRISDQISNKEQLFVPDDAVTEETAEDAETDEQIADGKSPEDEQGSDVSEEVSDDRQE